MGTFYSLEYRYYLLTCQICVKSLCAVHCFTLRPRHGLAYTHILLTVPGNRDSTSALDVGEWLSSRPYRFTRGENQNMTQGVERLEHSFKVYNKFKKKIRKGFCRVFQTPEK
jgi:hypothetical protein